MSETTAPCEHDTLGCGDRAPHDEHTKVGDGRPCCGWPPRCAQHPAAPETETDANGLTEAEREALGVAALGRGHAIHPRIEAVIGRIVAERVRVVEGERDAARGDLVFSRQTTTNVMEALADSGAETLAAIARAESAEAAHEAEKAAHERLRAGVEALADEWAEDYPGPNAACNRTPDEWATDLRALLGGGGER